MMRISTKRQVTIPKPKPKLSRGDLVVARLKSVRPSNDLSTDEIMELMRGASRATRRGTGRTSRG